MSDHFRVEYPHITTFGGPGTDWNFVDIISGFFSSNRFQSISDKIDACLSEILNDTKTLLKRYQPAVNALRETLVGQLFVSWKDVEPEIVKIIDEIGS